VLSVVLIWQRSNPAQPSGPEGPNSLLEPKILVPGHCKSESWLLLVEESVKTIKCKVEQLVLKYQTNRLLASCIGLDCCPWSGPRLDQPPSTHTSIHISTNTLILGGCHFQGDRLFITAFLDTYRSRRSSYRNNISASSTSKTDQVVQSEILACR